MDSQNLSNQYYQSDCHSLSSFMNENLLPLVSRINSVNTEEDFGLSLIGKRSNQQRYLPLFNEEEEFFYNST